MCSVPDYNKYKSGIDARYCPVISYICLCVQCVGSARQCVTCLIDVYGTLYLFI